jgi:hypothetical protein
MKWINHPVKALEFPWPESGNQIATQASAWRDNHFKRLTVETKTI